MWHLWRIVRHTELFSCYLSLGRLDCYFTAGNSDRCHIVYIKQLLKTCSHHIAHSLHKPASREDPVIFWQYIRNHPEVPVFLPEHQGVPHFHGDLSRKNPGRQVDWLVRKLLFLEKIFVLVLGVLTIFFLNFDMTSYFTKCYFVIFRWGIPVLFSTINRIYITAQSSTTFVPIIYFWKKNIKKDLRANAKSRWNKKN